MTRETVGPAVEGRPTRGTENLALRGPWHQNHAERDDADHQDGSDAGEPTLHRQRVSSLPAPLPRVPEHYRAGQTLDRGERSAGLGRMDAERLQPGRGYDEPGWRDGPRSDRPETEGMRGFQGRRFVDAGRRGAMNGVLGDHRSQWPPRQPAEGPQPDRVVDDPGQARPTRLVTRDEADHDRNKAEDDERPHDPFHEFRHPAGR